MRLHDELRKTFLFEKLSEEQLEQLVAAGSVVWAQAGQILAEDGAPAESLWMLLEGELELSRHLADRTMVLATTSRQGVYICGFRAYGESAGAGYRATTRALPPSRLFRLPSAELARLGQTLLEESRVFSLQGSRGSLQLGPAQLLALADPAGTKVVALDLGNVEYVTSTILGHLVALHKRLHGADGRLTLENVRPAVQDILRVTQLDQVLDARPVG